MRATPRSKRGERGEGGGRGRGGGHVGFLGAGGIYRPGRVGRGGVCRAAGDSAQFGRMRQLAQMPRVLGGASGGECLVASLPRAGRHFARGVARSGGRGR